MPTYDVTIDGVDYEVESQQDLTDAQAYEYAQMQAKQAPQEKVFAPPASTVVEALKGFGKGALNTVADLGELVHKIPGVSTAVDTLYGQPGISARAFEDADQQLQASNPAQQAGMYAETAGEMLLPGPAAIRGAKAVPGIVARAGGFSKARAVSNLDKVAEAAKGVAVNTEGPGQKALQIIDKGARGGTVPKGARDFAKRVTDPEQGPLTFDEGRDFYSNLAGLSRNAKDRLSPALLHDMKTLAKLLNVSLTEAAEQVGRGDDYVAGMREYARNRTLAKKVPVVKKAAAGAAGAAGAYSLIQHLLGKP